MSDTHVASAREALLAELFKDVDAMIQRFEHADATLSGRIEQATRDAAGKAFLTARLQFEAVIEQQAGKLTDAGRHAAARIGNELAGGTAQIAASACEADQRMRRWLFAVALVAVVAGAVGGWVGARMAALVG